MSNDTEHSPHSCDALLRFLKQAGIEGQINPASARSRRNAVEQLSVELTEAERNDVRTINVDELALRFHKLEGSSIRPEALKLYAERFRMGLSDYLAYTDQPHSFKSIGVEKARAFKRRHDGKSTLSAEQQAAEQIRLEALENPSQIVPVPLREREVVYVANLPLDLTPEEADKIARVVRAFAAERNADASCTGANGESS
ncbi:MAG: hypothetical protein AAF446_03665 [Pseudomonadota bacterium]